jgi:cytochrome b
MVKRGEESGAPVAVWDLPVRLFHWALVVLLVIAWSTAQAGLSWMTYHLWTGYAILTLILFRLLWGIFGSRHARFSDFIAAPGAAWRYARQLAAGRHPFYLGHNPLGGYMVALLLTLVLIQVSTGLFATDDILVSGPLADWVSGRFSRLLTGVHKLNVNILIGAVVVHVVAIGYYRWHFGENLVRAMVTGRKILPPGMTLPQETPSALGRALGLLALSAVAVYALINVL